MKPSAHVAVSTVVSGSAFLITNSIPLTVTSWLAGIFIDLDHVVDYLREYGFRLSPSHFLETFYHTRYKRVWLLFHGWEVMILLAAISYFTAWDPFTTGILIGCTHHLICDQFTNHASLPTYSLIWRLIKRFRVRETFPRLFGGREGKP
ncbi:MAG: hypothetical protein GF398_12365 [Chitinivibrionales bacterium]|nr:hypothetical protein [Chitinivibrionales bacterium]